MSHRHIHLPLLIVLLASCSTAKQGPTLESLSQRSVQVEHSVTIDADTSSVINAYESVATDEDSSLNIKAMHRLADAEMKQIDELMEQGQKIDQARFDKPIKWYLEVLKRDPQYPQREELLYQLAHAYEQSGDSAKSIKALQILSRDYPRSSRAVEAHFRRAEVLFQEQRFREAEISYAAVITAGRSQRFTTFETPLTALSYTGEPPSGGSSPFYEQSLFKYAWAIYKQDRCIDSLDAFFVLLDLKLNRNLTPTELQELAFLARADRELVDDSFRAINLCIATEGGAKALNIYLANKPPRVYEFLAYQKLAEHYLKQQLDLEAAEAYSAFWQRASWHPYALLFQNQAIEIYTRLGLKEKIIPAKRDFVQHYNDLEERWQNNEHSNYFEYLIRSDKELKATLQRQLELHLSDLASYYHATAQSSKTSFDYKNTVIWYRAYLRHFPDSPKRAEMNLHLADALLESGDYQNAAKEYEHVAYDLGNHDRAADAGYAALSTREKQHKAQEGDLHWDNATTQSALSFARFFPRDPRVPEVLARAADELYQAKQYSQAIKAAESVMSRYSSASQETKRTALTVLANTQFEQQKYEVAELFYLELQALLSRNDPFQKEIDERIAACIYKQAEHFRSQGVVRSAIEQFRRLIASAPNASVRPLAEYDIAMLYIQINEWNLAMQTLETFKKGFPNHPLVKDANEKIAVGYLKLNRPIEAAVALEGISEDLSPEAQREALWQVAELYEEGGELSKAANSFQRYAETFHTPLEPAVEALYKSALLYRKQGQENNYFIQMEKIYQADKEGGAARTNRTRYLAAQGTFELAEPHFQRYAEVKLVEPIRKNMELKNGLMKRALTAYNKTAEIGVAEFTVAATYRIADMYADFSRKLMDSDRPTDLNDEELEQYELMLEEQAFPFEEKAIGLHETNIKRLHEGLYNEWIARSITALAKLMPARYSRVERHDVAAPTPQ